jgi:hypothetical protein
MEKRHDIQEREAPTGYLVLCSCGWSVFVRKQNALARAAKIRTARKTHLAEIATCAPVPPPGDTPDGGA